MRYIGGKARLLTEIEDLINSKVKVSGGLFLDLFAGTGVVGNHFKPRFTVYANDSLYLSYAFCAGTLALNTKPKFTNVEPSFGDIFDFLNNLEPQVDESYFIYHNYSPAGEHKRKYFTSSNAAQIDCIRQQVASWFTASKIDKEQKYYLLASLIRAVSAVSNTTGTYGAYLKGWDSRALKPLTLTHPALHDNDRKNKAFQSDALKLARRLSVDVCYIDPPYNTRQYSANYHLLDTIALYDAPQIKGVTGIRDIKERTISPFSRKRSAHGAFSSLIKHLQAKHIVVSYSSDGLLSGEEIANILKKHGNKESFEFKSIDYNAYQSKRTSRSKVKEYLFYIKK